MLLEMITDTGVYIDFVYPYRHKIDFAVQIHKCTHVQYFQCQYSVPVQDVIMKYEVPLALDMGVHDQHFMLAFYLTMTTIFKFNQTLKLPDHNDNLSIQWLKYTDIGIWTY